MEEDEPPMNSDQGGEEENEQQQQQQQRRRRQQQQQQGDEKEEEEEEPGRHEQQQEDGGEGSAPGRAGAGAVTTGSDGLSQMERDVMAKKQGRERRAAGRPGAVSSSAPGTGGGGVDVADRKAPPSGTEALSKLDRDIEAKARARVGGSPSYGPGADSSSSTTTTRLDAGSPGSATAASLRRLERDVAAKMQSRGGAVAATRPGAVDSGAEALSRLERDIAAKTRSRGGGGGGAATGPGAVASGAEALSRLERDVAAKTRSRGGGGGAATGPGAVESGAEALNRLERDIIAAKTNSRGGGGNGGDGGGTATRPGAVTSGAEALNRLEQDIAAKTRGGRAASRPGAAASGSSAGVGSMAPSGRDVGGIEAGARSGQPAGLPYPAEGRGRPPESPDRFERDVTARKAADGRGYAAGAQVEMTQLERDAGSRSRAAGGVETAAAAIGVAVSHAAQAEGRHTTGESSAGPPDSSHAQNYDRRYDEESTADRGYAREYGGTGRRGYGPDHEPVRDRRQGEGTNDAGGSSGGGGVIGAVFGAYDESSIGRTGSYDVARATPSNRDAATASFADRDPQREAPDIAGTYDDGVARAATGTQESAVDPADSHRDELDPGTAVGIMAYVPDDEEDDVVEATDAVVVDPEEEEREHRRRQRKVLVVGCAALFAAIAAIVIPVSIKLTKDDAIEGPPPTAAPTRSPTTMPSAAPTTDEVPPLVGCLAEVTDPDVFLNRDSPQFRAALWSADEDEFAATTGLTCRDAKFLQRYALATFYYAMNGEEWTTCGKNNPGCTGEYNRWLSNTDECTWYRLGCGNGTITDFTFDETLARELEETYLDGEIPPEMSLLTGMIRFVATGMNMRGTLDAQFSTWSRLGTLILAGNNLSGRLPPNLGSSHPEMTAFQAGGNKFSGPAGPSVAGLALLEDLRLDNNILTGPIPSDLGDMENLTVLELQNNNLEDGIPAELYSLRKLEVLDVGGNHRLTGTLPKEIGGLAALKRLRVGSTAMGGTIPSEFYSLPVIVEADLRNASFTGTLSEDFVRLQTIRDVVLNDNDFFGPIPVAAFEKLPVLEELILQGNRLTGSISEALCDKRGTRSGQLQKLTVDCDIPCDCCDTCRGAR